MDVAELDVDGGEDVVNIAESHGLRWVRTYT